MASSREDGGAQRARSVRDVGSERTCAEMEAEALEAASEVAAAIRRLGMDDWLERMLVAERRAVALELERRHRLLVVEIDQRFRTQAVDAATLFGDSLYVHRVTSEPPEKTVSKASALPGGANPKRSFSSADIQEELEQAQGLPAHQTLRQLLSSIVLSHGFEMFFGLLILLNTAMMCMQAQYEGVHTDFLIKYSSESPDSARDVWPGLALGFVVIGWFFGIAFSVELLLKLIVLGRHFWCSTWNLVDFFVVLFWLIDKALAQSQIFTIDPMLLRFCRLARLLRLVKALKFIQAFDSLQVLIASIKGSMSVLLWSSLLLFAIMMICVMILSHFLTDYIRNVDNPESVRMELYQYFGSFSRGMVTMLEITLGNWVPVCRLLMENLMEWYGFFIVAYKIIIGFGVVKVITGCFLHETFKVAATDDEIMIMRKQREQDSHRGKMERLFAAADDQGNGTLTREEFSQVLSEPHVRHWLSAMEITFEDANMLFELISATQRTEDREEPRISVNEFLQGTTRLKGAARSLDMWQVVTHTEKIIADLRHLSEKVTDSELSRSNVSPPDACPSDLGRPRDACPGDLSLIVGETTDTTNI